MVITMEDKIVDNMVKAEEQIMPIRFNDLPQVLGFIIIKLNEMQALVNARKETPFAKINWRVRLKNLLVPHQKALNFLLRTKN